MKHTSLNFIPLPNLHELPSHSHYITLFFIFSKTFVTSEKKYIAILPQIPFGVQWKHWVSTFPSGKRFDSLGLRHQALTPSVSGQWPNPIGQVPPRKSLLYLRVSIWHLSTHLWIPVSCSQAQWISFSLSPFVWLCGKSLMKYSFIIAFITSKSYLSSTQEFQSGELYCMLYLRNSGRFTIYHLKGRTLRELFPVLFEHSLCTTI